MPKIGAYFRTYGRLLDRINQELRNSSLPTITPLEGFTVYRKYDGRCAECGAPLNVNKGMTFAFYIPLSVGGSPTVDNVIPVCHDDAHLFSGIKAVRKEILDLNSFADKIEVLFRSIKDGATYDKIKLLKRHINFTLEEIALNMRYKPYSDWEPSSIDKFVEDASTISETIEKIAETVIEDMPTKIHKNELTDQVKQILKTKKYRVLRPENED